MHNLCFFFDNLWEEKETWDDVEVWECRFVVPSLISKSINILKQSVSRTSGKSRGTYFYMKRSTIELSLWWYGFQLIMELVTRFLLGNDHYQGLFWRRRARFIIEMRSYDEFQCHKYRFMWHRFDWIMSQEPLQRLPIHVTQTE